MMVLRNNVTRWGFAGPSCVHMQSFVSAPCGQSGSVQTAERICRTRDGGQSCRSIACSVLRYAAASVSSTEHNEYSKMVGTRGSAQSDCTRPQCTAQRDTEQLLTDR